MLRIAMALAIVALASGTATRGADDAGRMVAHNVFVSLKDKSPDSVKRMLEATKKHFTGFPGVIFFAVGTRSRDGDGPAVDRDFDLSLHIIFRDRETHQRYMDSERRREFSLANRAHLGKVRLFVSEVEK
jgi:hypothetical protein